MRSPTILIFNLFFVAIHAVQPDFRKEVNIGFSQGFTIGRAYFEPFVEQQFFYGYSGGIVLRYISEPQLGIQFECNYLQKGWREDSKDFGYYERTLEVLDFPVLTHFYIGRKTKARINIELGPYIDYLLKDTEKNRITDTARYNAYYGRPVYRNFGLGYTAGLAFALRTRIGIFELKGDYHHSLTNLFKAGEEEFPYRGSRPQAVIISFRYLVKI